jgi:bifunctional enzyme CysN/CysC
VVVNKMDAVGYLEDVYERVLRDAQGMLRRLGLDVVASVPASARDGANVVRGGTEMPWWEGPTVCEMFERFQSAHRGDEAPFRMAVQDVYKTNAEVPIRRIVAGTVGSGGARLGDEVVLWPSGVTARIATIETWRGEPSTELRAGEAVGFTLAPTVYCARGDVVARVGERPPDVTTALRVTLMWLAQRPLMMGRDYVVRLGTANTVMRVEAIERVVDAGTAVALGECLEVGRHQVAVCRLALGKPVACDLATTVAATARFVIVDGSAVAGAGVVTETFDGGGYVVGGGASSTMQRTVPAGGSLVGTGRKGVAARREATAALLLDGKVCCEVTFRCPLANSDARASRSAVSGSVESAGARQPTNPSGRINAAPVAVRPYSAANCPLGSATSRPM